jgi:AcrR family transcriptional regulator
VAAVVQVPLPEPSDGGAGAAQPADLRTRKKERTRAAINDAALELFIEKGYEATTVDEIAERAEVSKATFFRYFATKAEVIFSTDGLGRHELRDAIVERPADEDDLTAVRRALLDSWVGQLDLGHAARQGRAAATSPLLRGLSYDLNLGWQGSVSSALAERRGLEQADQRCTLVASVVFAVFSNAFNAWLSKGGDGDFAAEVRQAFALLDGVFADIDGDG